MIRPLLPALIAAATLLSACHGASSSSDATANDNSTTDNAAGATGGNATAAAPMKLPPAIAKSTTYRCASGGVIAVDFMDDQVTAHLHPTPDAAPISLTAPEAGKAFAGSGYTLSGDGATVSYTAPDKKAETCNG